MKQLSQSNWQQVVQQATERLAARIPQCVFVTHARADVFTIRLAPRSDDGRGNELDDEHGSGLVTIRYWCRYRELREQLLEKFDSSWPKDIKPRWEKVLLEMVTFQNEWPVLEFNTAQYTWPLFLERLSRAQFVRRLRKGILEEAYRAGGVLRLGERGPFRTLEGRKIQV